VVTITAGTDTIEVFSTFVDAGATWTDNYDGSGTIATATSGSVNTNVVGTYTLTYSYTDAAGLTGSATRTVTVRDTTAPVVTINAGTDTIEVFSSFIDAGATWTDNYDGSGTIATATSGSVNTNVVGTYTLTYSYTDANGNTGSADRTVIVRDTTAPVVTLVGGNVSIERTHSYREQGATWTDNYDGSGIVAQISGSVNNDVRGDYVLTYSYTDKAGNIGSAQRTVHVARHDDGGNDGGGNGGGGNGGENNPIITLLTATTGDQGAVELATSQDGTSGLQVDQPQGEVQGAQTAKEDVTVPDQTDNSFNWWWLSLVAIVGLGWFGLSRRGIS
jgi:hypothetical protein